MERLNISAKRLAEYKRNALARWQAEQRALKMRRERAWRVARTAARVLKEKYGATRVFLFGSLARGKYFTARSDVDLAVWGVEESQFLSAVAAMLELDSQIEVDLINGETCPHSLRSIIRQEGVEL